MQGRELIRSTMSHQPTDRVPWVPFAGVHAGKLKGYSSSEVYTDSEKLYESLLEVNRIYKPDGLPIMFDLQMEAEALGCKLIWNDGVPPAVASHVLADTDEIPDRMITPDEARLPLAFETCRRVKQAIGEQTAIYGLFCGPFTLASHLRGTKLFRDMKKDESYVKKLMEYTTRIGLAMAGYYVDAGADVVAVVDPLVSQISPKHFELYMHEPFSRLFACIREKGAFSSFFVCGNATFNLEPMCKTQPDSISVDENVSMTTAQSITAPHNIALGGNLPLTTVMLYGNQQDNMKAVVDLLDALDHHNLVLSPGCDMPYDTPIENVVAAQQAVRETEQARKFIENYSAADIVFEGTLPDYGALEKPLVEVFTLDSATCAACTYMWASAQDAQRHFGDRIDVVEYKYSIPQHIARIRAMGVKQLPSIYINGQLKYSSIIPNQDELFQEIERCLK